LSTTEEVNEHVRTTISYKNLIIYAVIVTFIMLLTGIIINNIRLYLGLLIVANIIIAIILNIIGNRKNYELYLYTLMLILFIGIIVYNYLLLSKYLARAKFFIPLPFAIYMELHTRNGIEPLLELDWSQVSLIISLFLLRKIITLLRSFRSLKVSPNQGEESKERPN